nr:immunoglobulin light chain junction region [Macaca mulatta]
CGQGAKVPPTF